MPQPLAKHEFSHSDSRSSDPFWPNPSSFSWSSSSSISSFSSSFFLSSSHSISSDLGYSVSSLSDSKPSCMSKALSSVAIPLRIRLALSTWEAIA